MKPTNKYQTVAKYNNKPIIIANEGKQEKLFYNGIEISLDVALILCEPTIDTLEGLKTINEPDYLSESWYYTEKYQQITLQGF